VDVTALLEKNDYLQLNILKVLFNLNRAVSKKELTVAIGSTSFMTEKNAIALSETLETLDYGVHIIQETIDKASYFSVKKEAHANIKFIYFHFLKHSLDYQMLVNLFEQPHQLLFDYAEKYALSESNIYVHFTHINRFLEPYHIRIVNNQLAGDPLPICYLFYQLYWNTLPLYELADKFHDEHSLAFIQELERALGYHFPPEKRLKVQVWLRVIAGFPQDDLLISSALFEQIKAEPLFDTLNELNAMNLKFSGDFPVNENFLVYLYIFLSSLFILPVTLLGAQEDKWPTTIEKVKQINDVGYDLLVDYLHPDFEVMPMESQKEMSYQLSQLHAQLFYFGSFIMNITSDVFASAIPIERFGNDILLRIADTMMGAVEIVLNEELTETTRKNMTYVYLTVLKQVEQYSTLTIRVGVFSYISELHNSLILTNVISHHQQQLPIIFEKVDVNTYYDLIITNTDYFLDDGSYGNYYVYGSSETKLDIVKVDALIQQIRTAKLFSKQKSFQIEGNIVY
jgi:hypothetical protein